MVHDEKLPAKMAGEVEGKVFQGKRNRIVQVLRLRQEHDLVKKLREIWLLADYDWEPKAT